MGPWLQSRLRLALRGQLPRARHRSVLPVCARRCRRLPGGRRHQSRGHQRHSRARARRGSRRRVPGHGRHVDRIGHGLGERSDVSDEAVELLSGPPAEETVAGEDGFQLIEEQRTGDQPEDSHRCRLDDSLRVAAGDGSGDEDVGIDNDSSHRRRLARRLRQRRPSRSAASSSFAIDRPTSSSRTSADASSPRRKSARSSRLPHRGRQRRPARAGRRACATIPATGARSWTTPTSSRGSPGGCSGRRRRSTRSPVAPCSPTARPASIRALASRPSGTTSRAGSSCSSAAWRRPGVAAGGGRRPRPLRVAGRRPRSARAGRRIVRALPSARAAKGRAGWTTSS